MAEYDVWAPDYDDWAAEMTEDVAWYVSLAEEATEPIVELGVGTGRIAIPIARETGKRVLGFDRSTAMLAVGRERAGSGEVAVRLNGARRELGESWEIPRYAWADSRIDITRGRDDEEVGTLRLWWIGRSEFEGLIEIAGLEVEELYGWFDGRPYDDSSLEMVWIARKP